MPQPTLSHARKSRVNPDADGLPRVVVDLEKIRHMNCGLGRFSLHLGREIRKAAQGRVEPVFLVPKAADKYFSGETIHRINVALWRKETLLRLVRPLVQPLLPKPTVSLWHVTHQASRYLPLDARVPVLLTIHDLNFLHGPLHDEYLKDIKRKLADIQQRVNRAVAIVTDSEYVARNVQEHIALGGRPVHVVPLGLSEPCAASAAPPAFAPSGPFLLSVGNASAHKNFHVLFDLLEKLPGQRLVVAGKKATPYGEFLEREVARKGLVDRVILPGEVSDADRQWLYEHCEAFLFPSLTEGFGFPVLEAMQCGKPVFVSRRTSLPEIASSHGFYFDAFDAASMAAAYWAGMAAFRADTGFAAKAQAHAAGFVWAETARGYVRLYEQIVAGL